MKGASQRWMKIHHLCCFFLAAKPLATTSRTGLFATALFLVVCSFVCGVSSASGEEIFPTNNRPFYLFSGGPGARALGMGGAFIAVADDASAIEWNPAGMGTLRRMQILFEIVNRSYPVDNFTLEQFEAKNRTINESFNLAFVYPTKWGHVGFGIFHAAHWHQKWTWQDKIYIGQAYTPTYSFTNMKNKSALDVYNFDLAYSYDIGSHFSLGITGRLHQMLKKYSFTTLHFDKEYRWLKEAETRRYDYSVVVGALFRPVKQVCFGLVTKTPVSFRYSEYLGDGQRKIDHINIPATVGLGITFDVLEFFKITTDINYTEYSEVGNGSLIVGKERSHVDEITLKTHEDSCDYHFGIQYVFPLTIQNRRFIFGSRLGFFTRRPYNVFYDRQSPDSPPYEQMFPQDQEEEHTQLD